MPTYKYKNVSDQDQVVIGVGIVEAGKTVETNQEIINANFEVVGRGESKSNKNK